MGCHQKSLARQDQRLREALDPASPWHAYVDELLERRFDSVHRATEWDASKWGFDPDRWCEAERVEMDRRVQ